MEWISVKHLLPQNDENVIFFVKGRNEIFAGKFDSYNARFSENLDAYDFDNEKITHWMPLPFPPKE